MHPLDRRPFAVPPHRRPAGWRAFAAGGALLALLAMPGAWAAHAGTAPPAPHPADRNAPGLKSGIALLVDQDSQHVLVQKNAAAVVPIASITKLMTALVVVESGDALDEVLTVTEADVDTVKGSASRLPVGTRLARRDLLHLALMSSENRAAHALGRAHRGGMAAFVAAMNARAARLKMQDTHFSDPTGLRSDNRSSAWDLALLVAEASRHPLLRSLSTAEAADLALGDRLVAYRNTNPLVRDAAWTIGLQKTGYIAEAGRCLVMQAKVAGRRLILVLLDSAGSQTRFADAWRALRWVESMTPVTESAAAPVALQVARDL